MTHSPLDQFLPSLSVYTNEIIATGLFGVGYYLYRLFSDKTTTQNLPKAKEPCLTASTPLQYYNQGLKVQLLKLKVINPAEILHQIELEGFKPDVSTFNTLMDGCFETGNLKQGFWVFDEMKSSLSYVKPDLVSFNILMKGIGLNGSWCFEEIINEMIINGLKPNLTTFNTIIDHCLRRKDLKATMKYLGLLRENFLEPDFITIALIYKGLKDHDLKEIMDFCEEAQELIGFECESLYNVRIEACFNHGAVSKAISLISEMKELDVNMSAMTYGVMLKGYGIYKNLHSINEIINEINEKRPELKENEITMGCLIDALIRCNALEKAEEFLINMPKLQGNIVIQSILLKGYTKQRNMQKALDCFQRMIDNKIKPNIISYNSLLECAIQSKDYKKAEELYKELEIDKQADIITYSCYMKGLLKQRRIQETMDLLEVLRKEKKGEIDEILYNSLMDGLVKLKESNLVMKLYEKMQSDHIKPGIVTYSILMKAYYMRGEIDAIFNLMKELKASGLTPSLIIYTCMIQTCVKSRRIQEMINFYEEMIDAQIKPDMVFLNIFISGLCFNYHVKMACQLLSNSINKGIRLNNEVYGNVLKSLLRDIQKKFYGNKEIKGNFEKSDAELELLKISCSMRKAGIDIEIGLYNEIATVLMNQSNDRGNNRVMPEKKRPPRFFNRNLIQK